MNPALQWLVVLGGGMDLLAAWVAGGGCAEAWHRVGRYS